MNKIDFSKDGVINFDDLGEFKDYTDDFIFLE